MIEHYQGYQQEIVNKISFISQNVKEEIKSDPFSNLLVFWQEKKVIGYLLYSKIYDRIELDQIEVIKEKRHKGIASMLLKELMMISNIEKTNNITLEVNEHNDIAIHLYHKFGFKEVAKRNHYYKDGDALLMLKEVNEQ